MSVQALWALDAMASAMQARRQGPLPASIGGISIDSRTLGAGDAFFAIAGDNRDGHDFVDAALQAGAGLAVVSAAKRDAFAADAPLLVVDDVLEGLRDLARAARARFAGKVIAVTGSVGKTSTKEALRLVLSRQGKTHASAASYNNHWGVPLTLARMPSDTQYAVFEIGMNHANEIRPLTKMVRPHAAIVTTVEAVHLEHFANVEAIADAKAEIFEGLEEGGAAIIKRDNPHYGRLASHASRVGATIVGFGFGRNADGAIIASVDTGDGSTITLNSRNGQSITQFVAMPGHHNAENALAVAAVLDAVGAPLDLALAALAELAPPPGRGARTRLAAEDGDVLLIDESYNANPASMRAALATLATVSPQKFPRRIAVLGDMLELGPAAPQLHRDLFDAVDDAGVSLLFACGPLMKGLYDAAPSAMKGGYAATAAELVPLVISHIHAGDVLMVKASNGTKLGTLVDALKARFTQSEALH